MVGSVVGLVGGDVVLADGVGVLRPVRRRIRQSTTKLLVVAC